MRVLKLIEEFFQNSSVPETFIQEHREEIIAFLDDKAFQRAYQGKFKYFLVVFPLVVGGLNYTKNDDIVMPVFWGFFSLATAIAIYIGGKRKSEKHVNSAKYCLEIISSFGVILTAILAGHTESTGFITRGGPIQFAFIIQAANPFWFDREKLVLRGIILGVMSYFFAAHFYSEFYTILVSQILIGVPVSIIFTLLLHSGEISQVYIKTLAAKEKHALEIDGAHAWKQLGRLVHPHQHHLLKMGHVLEETMSLEIKPAIVSEFDLKGSGELSKILGYDAYKGNLFKVLSNKYLYENYRFSSEWNVLNVPVSRGYLFKDMGDGFIYTVGYPFRSEESNLAEDAVKIAFEMIAFSKNYFKSQLNIEPEICITIVSSMVQGIWKAANVTSYDFTDRSIIPISRLSGFRRLLEECGAIAKNASHILIKQDVYDALEDCKKMFSAIEIKKHNLTLRESDDAYVYYCEVT